WETAFSTSGSPRSMPVARSRSMVKSVDSHFGASFRRHEPSGCWQLRIAAPRPSRATRVRSNAVTEGEASVRSRIVCQRIAGSESRSHWRTSTSQSYPVELAALVRLQCRVLAPGVSHERDVLVGIFPEREEVLVCLDCFG